MASRAPAITASAERLRPARTSASLTAIATPHTAYAVAYAATGPASKASRVWNQP